MQPQSAPARSFVKESTHDAERTRSDMMRKAPRCSTRDIRGPPLSCRRGSAERMREPTRPESRLAPGRTPRNPVAPVAIRLPLNRCLRPQSPLLKSRVAARTPGAGRASVGTPFAASRVGTPFCGIARRDSLAASRVGTPLRHRASGLPCGIARRCSAEAGGRGSPARSFPGVPFGAFCIPCRPFGAVCSFPGAFWPSFAAGLCSTPVGARAAVGPGDEFGAGSSARRFPRPSRAHPAPINEGGTLREEARQGGGRERGCVSSAPPPSFVRSLNDLR
eukprot:gene4083-biopygen3605